MRALRWVALLLAACTPPEPPEPPAQSAQSARTPPENDGSLGGAVTSTDVARASDARVEVSFAGPTRVLYSSSSMRSPRPEMHVAITNPTTRPLDVSDLRVRLDVTRGSQRVRCEEARGDEEARRREPAVLSPGASSVFIRSVDCPLALAGVYVVQVVVAFGEAEPFANGVVAKELAVSIGAPSEAQPRAVASVPGLHGAIGPGGRVPSSTGTGRIVVALANTTDDAIVLPAMRVAVRVRRAGTDIPCEDEPTKIALPPRLEGGAVVTRPVDVSCLGLGVAGTYDVEARLLVGEEAFPIGSLRVDVSTDPSRRNGRPPS